MKAPTDEGIPVFEGKDAGTDQVIFWIVVGSVTLLIAILQHRNAQAKQRKGRTQKIPEATATGRAGEEVPRATTGDGDEVQSLLERGDADQPEGPVYAESIAMLNVCKSYTVKNGLEAASLAVLSAFVQRHQYNPPTIGVCSDSKATVVDLELLEGSMTFASLLNAADKALTAVRSKQPSADADDGAPPEVTLMWGQKATGSGEWSIEKSGHTQLLVTGTSKMEERSFKILFEACALNPTGDVWQMPLFSETTLARAKTFGRALKDFKLHRSDFDGSLIPVPKLLLKVPASLSAEAVAGQEFSYTYQELRHAVNAVSLAVQQLMEGKGSKSVVLFMGRGKMIAPAFIGILQAGCTVVPVDVHWPSDRAKDVAIDSGAQLVLTDPASSIIWAEVGAGALPSLEVNDKLFKKHSSEHLLHTNHFKACEELTQEDGAVVLFTSGSTGKPKGILLSHGYLTALVIGVGETKEMSPHTRTLCYHSPTWMPFLDYLLAPLLQGGCCLFYPENATHIVKPNELNDFARAKKATLLGLVPAVLEIFVEDGLPPTLSTIGVGGAAVTSDLLIRVAETHESKGMKNLLLTTGYSGTEQGDVTNIRMRCVEDVEIAAGDKTIMGAGRPHAGQTHAIVDRGMNLVGPGAVGQVMVCGPGLATCYLGMPQLTSEYFVKCQALDNERAATTGDLGKWSNDGSLQLVGRLGSMVKVRGARVDLGEVEVAVAAHDAVKACVVVVHEDKLVAYVQPAVPGDLRDFCKARLVAYMVPHMFEGLEELPRLANGKVNKKALKPPAPREDGTETVMEMDSLGQMRKFSRKDAAEDLVLDNVRAILLGMVIMSHSIPLFRPGFNAHHANPVQMLSPVPYDPRADTVNSSKWLHYQGSEAHWTLWQYWILYMLRSGGWSSLAFLSGFDDTRAEHKGYGLTYREALFVIIWVVSGFHWSGWYFPAFVLMRLLFVFWKKIGLEYFGLFLTAQIFLTMPAFVDTYIGYKPPSPGQETTCTCFCPLTAGHQVQTVAYYLIGYWSDGPKESYIGHRLIFVPCYLIGLYCGKYLFPLLCKLAVEPSWLRRGAVAALVMVAYWIMWLNGDKITEDYNDSCSSYWNNGSFVWEQVRKNMTYFALNLSMSLLYVILIVALVKVHLKYLAKVSFFSLILNPLAFHLLDLTKQALAIRSFLQPVSIISPYVEMMWVMAVPFLYELVCGAMATYMLTTVVSGATTVWQRISAASVRLDFSRLQPVEQEGGKRGRLLE